MYRIFHLIHSFLRNIYFERIFFTKRYFSLTISLTFKNKQVYQKGGAMTKSLKELILAAEFSAIIAALSQFTLPLGLIPLTGQTFAIGLTATFLGKRTGTMAVFIYLLLGLIGLPVFSGMTGGIGVLFGPTGGYLIGFIFQTLVIGWIVEKLGENYSQAFFANLLGSATALLVGTTWLKFSGGLPLHTAFLSGFVPFLFPELIKGLAAAYIGILLRNRLFAIVDRTNHTNKSGN